MSEFIHTARSIHRLIVFTVTAKGVAMGALLSAMIRLSERGTLSPFEAALIIAVVSATITGIFTIIGAIIAIRLQQGQRHDIRAIREKVVEEDDSSEDVGGSTR